MKTRRKVYFLGIEKDTKCCKEKVDNSDTEAKKK